MKMLHNVAATLIAMLAAHEIIYPRSITSRNRLHTERAPRGSAEELARLEAAEAKRQRKLAKRASHSSGDEKS